MLISSIARYCHRRNDEFCVLTEGFSRPNAAVLGFVFIFGLLTECVVISLLVYCEIGSVIVVPILTIFTQLLLSRSRLLLIVSVLVQILALFVYTWLGSALLSYGIDGLEWEILSEGKVIAAFVLGSAMMICIPCILINILLDIRAYWKIKQKGMFSVGSEARICLFEFDVYGFRRFYGRRWPNKRTFGCIQAMYEPEQQKIPCLRTQSCPNMPLTDSHKTGHRSRGQKLNRYNLGWISSVLIEFLIVILLVMFVEEPLTSYLIISPLISASILILSIFVLLWRERLAAMFFLSLAVS
ncbi:hypothetical protein M3Y96_00378500 [Aphelenchoides besseyi]|nr:hypothetical protein M3Y96_00378500 [Aphelenchoides besseyi]